MHACTYLTYSGEGSLNIVSGRHVQTDTRAKEDGISYRGPMRNGLT